MKVKELRKAVKMLSKLGVEDNEQIDGVRFSYTIDGRWCVTFDVARTLGVYGFQVTERKKK